MTERNACQLSNIAVGRRGWAGAEYRLGNSTRRKELLIELKTGHLGIRSNAGGMFPID